MSSEGPSSSDQYQYPLRYGSGRARGEPLPDKGTLTYAVREYVIPSLVFAAMIYWLFKNIILPIVREPALIPTYTGWGGGRRNGGGGGGIAGLEVVDADTPYEDEEDNAATATTEGGDKATAESQKTK